jgi:hypothetical protein
MTDTSPEALDALIAKAEGRAGYLVSRGDTVTPTLLDQLASAVAALRAAPVAMREGAARIVQPAGKRPCDCDRCYCQNVGDAEAVAAWDAQNAAAEAIRALPLDAPAPVDPAWDRVAQGVFHEVPAPIDPVATYTATVDVGSVDDTRRVYQGFRQVDPVAEALGRIDVLELARMFHEAYESLAPYHGYVTRPETRTFDPASNNGRLMIATCKAVLGASAIRAREGGKP